MITVSIINLYPWPAVSFRDSHVTLILYFEPASAWHQVVFLLFCPLFHTASFAWYLKTSQQGISSSAASHSKHKMSYVPDIHYATMLKWHHSQMYKIRHASPQCRQSVTDASVLTAHSLSIGCQMVVHESMELVMHDSLLCSRNRSGHPIMVGSLKGERRVETATKS
jgi:hypothetical protein